MGDFIVKIGGEPKWTVTIDDSLSPQEQEQLKQVITISVKNGFQPPNSVPYGKSSLQPTKAPLQVEKQQEQAAADANWNYAIAPLRGFHEGMSSLPAIIPTSPTQAAVNKLASRAPTTPKGLVNPDAYSRVAPSRRQFSQLTTPTEKTLGALGGKQLQLPVEQTGAIPLKSFPLQLNPRTEFNPHEPAKYPSTTPEPTKENFAQRQIQARNLSNTGIPSGFIQKIPSQFSTINTKDVIKPLRGTQLNLPLESEKAGTQQELPFVSEGRRDLSPTQRVLEQLEKEVVIPGREVSYPVLIEHRTSQLPSVWRKANTNTQIKSASSLPQKITTEVTDPKQITMKSSPEFRQLSPTLLAMDELAASKGKSTKQRVEDPLEKLRPEQMGVPSKIFKDNTIDWPSAAGYWHENGEFPKDVQQRLLTKHKISKQDLDKFESRFGALKPTYYSQAPETAGLTGPEFGRIKKETAPESYEQFSRRGTRQNKKDIKQILKGQRYPSPKSMGGKTNQTLDALKLPRLSSSLDIESKIKSMEFPETSQERIHPAVENYLLDLAINYPSLFKRDLGDNAFKYIKDRPQLLRKVQHGIKYRPKSYIKEWWD